MIAVCAFIQLKSGNSSAEFNISGSLEEHISVSSQVFHKTTSSFWEKIECQRFFPELKNVLN